MSIKAQVKERLALADASPNKAYGQNFLIEEPILDRIAAEAHGLGSDFLEIGPGPGTLTERLVRRCRRLTVVEKDRRLAEFLVRAHPGIHVIRADVLQVDLSRVMAEAEAPVAVGNLPYNISGPFLAQLVEARHHFRAGLFMLQEEVAVRLAAPPGSKTYGSLSVLLQSVGQVEKLRRVPPQAFWPAPKVYSAVVRLGFTHPNAVPPDRWRRFRDWVRTAFQQRRKTLRNSLAPVTDPVRLQQAAAQVGIDLRDRPERLSWQQFQALEAAYPEADATP